MAWYNNIGDLWGDVKQIATGHNPSNNPPPSPIPAGGPSGLPMAPSAPGSGPALASTQPVYPAIPGDTTGSGDSGSGGIDWGSLISKIPGWVVDGLKTGLPAAIEWMKNNAGTLVQGASVADAAYRELQADKYANLAMSDTQDLFNQEAPLRTAGIAGMLNPGMNTPNLGALRTLAGSASGNPFAKGLPMAGPAAVGNHGPGAAPPQPVPLPMGVSGQFNGGVPVTGAGRLNVLANKAAGIPFAGRLTNLLPKPAPVS